MFTANPNIAGDTDRRFWHFRRGILIGQTARDIGIIQEQIIKLFGIKA